MARSAFVDDRPPRVVITGGIGSGKSYVGARLAARGWTVIQADQIGHRVLSPGGAAFAAVSRRWPEVVTGGAIDRAALGRIVFADPVQLAELESISHPAIADELERIVAGVNGPVAVEIPLLGRLLDGWPRVVVDADDEVRVGRLSRRGMSDADIRARMAAQPARDTWLAAASHVIRNDPDADLDAELDRFEAWAAADAGGPSPDPGERVTGDR